MNALPQLQVIPNFVEGEELAIWQALLFADSFWENENFLPGMVNYAHPTMPDGYQDLEASLVIRMESALEDFFGFEMTTAPSPGFRKWTVGGSQGLHLDHGDFNHQGQVVIDFEQPPHRRWPRCLNEYATVLYWNNNFEGGDIYFASAKNSNDILATITPEPGMLVMFPCSENYAHGVTEITQGERIISTYFWTKAQTAASMARGINVSEEAIHRRFGEKVRKRLDGGFLPNV